jgi:hypothetical protein
MKSDLILKQLEEQVEKQGQGLSAMPTSASILPESEKGNTIL